jgi:hypothetical protein
MAVFSAQELLQRHRITYVETRKGKFTTKCPNCSDNYLSVEIKNDGVVWFCQSCQEGSGEKFEQGKAGELGPIKAIYDYTDENGKLLFQVLRFEPINSPKEFRQRTGPDQERWSIKGVRIVPFHLPEVMEAVANDQTVFVCEGEKDVLTLQRLGIVATCNPMGAKKWWAEFNELLKGADVVICIDNDEPGHEHGRMVAENLIPVAKRVRLFDLARYWPKIEPSDDISDWAEQGGTAEQLWPMVEQLPALDQISKLNGFGKPNGKDHHGADAPPLVVATPYVLPDPATLARRAWIKFHHYMRGIVASTVAPGGYGKTSLSIYEALEIIKDGFCVWYISAEDDRTELDRRIAAYVQRHGILPAQLQDRFFVDDKLSFPFKIARTGRGGGVLFDDAKLDAFEAVIACHKIDVAIFDPFISFHYLPENDTAAMDALIKRLGDICTRQSMCIELPHHVRKRPSGQGEITVDDARGAGAIVNAVRSCRVINIMSTIEAEQAEIERDKRAFYLRIDSGKSNMAPPDKARWLHLASVEIANGDNVGVIEPWEFPKVFGKISLADADWVRELVRIKTYRADSRSPDWLGHELAERFGRSVTELGNIKWINAVLTTWVRNGVIGKEQRTDKDRKPRACFVPAGGNSEPHAAENAECASD